MLHDTQLPHPDFEPQDRIMAMTLPQAVKALAHVKTAMICRAEAHKAVVKVKRITEDGKLGELMLSYVNETSYLLEYRKALELRIQQLEQPAFSITYMATRA